jgi:hypothetical protein
VGYDTDDGCKLIYSYKGPELGPLSADISPSTHHLHKQKAIGAEVPCTSSGSLTASVYKKRFIAYSQTEYHYRSRTCIYLMAYLLNLVTES